MERDKRAMCRSCDGFQRQAEGHLATGVVMVVTIFVQYLCIMLTEQLKMANFVITHERVKNIIPQPFAGKSKFVAAVSVARCT
jgi:hypothetical protein